MTEYSTFLAGKAVQPLPEGLRALADLPPALFGFQAEAVQWALEPVRLHVLAAMPGSPEDERSMHRRFSHLRQHGEWFKPDADLLGVIEAARNAAREARRSA